jgi:hypothetical protein
MKDLFKEASKKDQKIYHRGPMKMALHRRIRHFLKRLLTKEVKEIENDRQSRQ